MLAAAPVTELTDENWATLTLAQRVHFLKQSSLYRKKKAAVMGASLPSSDAEALETAQKLKTLETELASAQQQLQLYDQIKQNAKTTTAENESFKAKLKKKEDQLKAATGDTSKLKAELDTLKKEYDEFKSSAAAKLLTLQDDKKMLEQKIEKLQADVKSAQTQLNAEQAKLTAANAELEQLKKHKADTAVTVQNLQSKLTSAEAAVTTGQQKYQKLQQDALALNNAVQANLAKAIEEKATLQTDVAQLKQQLQINQQKTAQSQAAALKITEALQKSLAESEQKLSAANEKYEKLKQDGLIMFEDYKKNLIETQTDLAEANKKLESLEQLKKELAEKDALIEQQKEKLSTTEAKNKLVLENLLNTVQEAEDQLVKEFNEELDRVGVEYMKKVKEKENEIQNLQKQTETLQVLLESKSKALKDVESQNKTLKEELEALQKRNVELLLVKERQEEELQQLGEAERQKHAEAQKYLTEKKAAEKKVQELQNQIQALEGGWAKKREQHANELREKDTITEKLKNLKNCVEQSKQASSKHSKSDAVYDNPIYIQLITDLNNCLNLVNVK